MAKRFFCTNIFDSVEMRTMKPEYKLFWFYLLAKCNHAGLWLNPDLELAEFQLGVKLDKKTIMQQFGSDIEIINEKHLYLKKFVHFQYGELNPNVKAHLSVIKLLDKYNIAHSKELGKSLTTVKDKYKDNTKIKTIDQREQEFFKQVQKVADKDMSSEVLDDFCNYWTEKNIGGTKMRYEKENTFDISRRLIRWSKMSKEWNKDKETASGHKLNDFKFDTTGNARIGYCSKCNKSDFYDKWNIVTQDSTCCKVEVKPTK